MAVAVPQVVQVFDSTLSDRVGGGQIRFITVPSRSWVDPSNPFDASAVVESLDLKDGRFVESEFDVFEVFQGALVREYHYVLDDPYGQGLDPGSRSLVQFVEQAVFTNVVPFEESPLDLTSIATLIKQATGVGLGAYVGFLVAGGPTPLLFLTVPAGMLIVGTAAGVAKALEVGLNYRLLRLMGVPTREQEPPSSPATATTS
jgi:hypothetical protein